MGRRVLRRGPRHVTSKWSTFFKWPHTAYLLNRSHIFEVTFYKHKSQIIQHISISDIPSNSIKLNIAKYVSNFRGNSFKWNWKQCQKDVVLKVINFINCRNKRGNKLGTCVSKLSGIDSLQFCEIKKQKNITTTLYKILEDTN